MGQIHSICQVNIAIDKTLLLPSIPKVDNQEMLDRSSIRMVTACTRRDDRRKKEQEKKAQYRGRRFLWHLRMNEGTLSKGQVTREEENSDVKDFGSSIIGRRRLGF
jgi:hypothetical protein